MAGRSPYYIILEDGKIVEIISNPFASQPHAGAKVAALLREKGVDAVVATSFGPHFRAVMKCRLIEKQGTLGEVMREWS